MITLFSGQTPILIYQEIINIYLAYHGCQISLMRETWKQTSGPILTTLEALLCHKNRYGYSGGVFPYTSLTLDVDRYNDNMLTYLVFHFC